MNLLQMLCCSLIVRGGELGQQYLVSKSDTIQSTLRARRAQTAVEAGLYALVQELTLSGKDVCKCEGVEATPTTASRILKDNGATWNRPKN